MRKVDDDFGRIRRELSELAATGREALGDVNLTEKLGDLAHRAARLCHDQEMAAADLKRQKSGEIYDEFGNAIIVFLKAYKGNPVIWSVIDSYMERNPEVFGLRYRAGFNRWIEQAENDPNVVYYYDPDTRVESWAWRPASENGATSDAIMGSDLSKVSSVDLTESTESSTEPEPPKKLKKPEESEKPKRPKKPEKLTPLPRRQVADSNHTLYSGDPGCSHVTTDMPTSVLQCGRPSYSEKEGLIKGLCSPVEESADPVVAQLTDWGLQIIEYADGGAAFSIESDPERCSEKALYPVIIGILGRSKKPMTIEDMCRAFAEKEGLEYSLFIAGNDERTADAKLVQEAIRSVVHKAIRILKTKLSENYLSEKLYEDVTYVDGNMRKKRVTYQLDGVLGVEN